MNYLDEEPITFGRLMLTTILVALVFIIWAMFFTPKNPTFQMDEKEVISEKAEQKDSPKPQHIDFKGVIDSSEEKEPILENNFLKIQFSNKGGVIKHAYLKNYKSRDGEFDDLVSPLADKTKTYPFMVSTLDEDFDKEINSKLFHVEQFQNSVVFTYSDGVGTSVRKTFNIDKEGYIISFDVVVIKDGKPLQSFFLNFGPGLAKLSKEQAKNRYFQQEYVGFEANNSFKKILRAKELKEPFVDDTYKINGTINFVGIANNYFTAIFLKDKNILSFKVRTFPLNEELKKVHPSDSDIYLLVESEGKGSIYLGPKDYLELKKLKGLVFRMMNWGWGWFSEICYILLLILKKLYLFTKNYGTAILLLTLIVKLLFYPLTQNSMVKMKEMGEAMKKLKPQIDRIRARYKKQGLDMQSRARMNEEIMALYQKEGVNPLGGMSGCLPLLLQMPIFWALFTMLPNTIDLRGAHFIFWIKDLSLPDPLFITPILMGISMVLSTMMTSTQSVEPAQRVMLYIMPIMFTWFCFWAPAGLTIYWLANNILTMAQQYIINKQVEKRLLLKQKEKKSTPKGASKPSHG